MAALTIRRAGTVYSLSQLEAEYPTASEALPLAPAKGFLSAPDEAVRNIQGALLPLYRYPAPAHGGGAGGSGSGSVKLRVRSFGDLAAAAASAAAVPDVDDARPAGLSDEEWGGDTMSTSSGGGRGNQVVPQRSLLDVVLLAEWEDRAEAGLFRYDVTACPTRVLPGAYGFVAQCNEGRASKKRPTEFRVDQVHQPFDESKFNFTKALQKEVLFQLEASPPGERTASFSAAAPAPASPHLVFINVSPIEYGHVLLVPRVVDRLPQLVTPDTLALALRFASEAANPYFRLVYNSLGAYGTVNHLHFQAYYLQAPYAIERAPTVPLPAGVLSAGGAAKAAAARVVVQQLAEYPVRALVFEAQHSLEELARVVGEACQRLTARNVPHNLLIADCGARVFLYPNCFAERKARGEVPEDVLETQVDPAGFEIAGHIVLKREQDYAAASQEAAWRLLSYASCDEQRFAQVARIALGEEGAGCPLPACGKGGDGAGAPQ